MDISWLNKHKYEIAAFLLFVLAWGLRANVDGLPLTHPGNIKAADPMYHTLAADIIVESGRYGNLAPYFAQGYTNMIDPSPPLNYLATAAISKVSGLPVWVVMYLLVTLFEAFGAIILFFLCSKIFDSKQIGLLAAGLYVLPFGLQDWWYGMYIGLWNNVGGFFFFYASLLLAYEYWQKQSRWAVFALSLTVAGAWLIHVAELFITAFAVGFVGLRLLWKVPSVKEKVTHALLLGVVPLLSVILFWPRYQELSSFLTSGSGAESSLFGWYYNVLPTLPFYTSLGQFPWWLLAIAGLGLLQLLVNWRKYLPLLVGETYLFCHLFIFPWFLSAYYFFVRQRMALPFIIAPLVAYGAYHLIVKNISKYTKLREEITVIALIVLVIGLGWSEYQGVTGIKQQEHLTPAKYDAMHWLQENTPEDAELVFVTGYYQMSGSYAKRIGFVFDVPDAIPALQAFVQSNGTVNLTLPYLGANGDTEMAHNALDEGSFFNYGRGKKRYGPMNVLNFDYAVFADFQIGEQPIIQLYNNRMMGVLVQEHGWKPVYSKNGIYILQRSE